MPSFVPRNLEPYQKWESYEGRLRALRGAVNAGAGAARVANAAEKVRRAAFAVIKAKRALLASGPSQLTLPAGHPEETSVTRQLDNLRQEEERWRSLSVADIVALAVEADAAPGAAPERNEPNR